MNDVFTKNDEHLILRNKKLLGGVNEIKEWESKRVTSCQTIPSFFLSQHSAAMMINNWQLY